MLPTSHNLPQFLQFICTSVLFKFCSFVPLFLSASDKKADISRFGVPYSIDCNHDLSLDSPFSSRTCGSETPHNGRSIDSSTSSSNHRASLEKDVYLLQSRLQQEKSMRIMLEKAIGRASSALSPGHRHLASQAKELIAEIELLEEEVSNREQHVLTLYRNIFEQCASQPSSVQTSSMSSPVHTKNKPRKHPSKISSATCSSKKFPLRGLSLKSTSAKKDGKIKHGSLCVGKIDIHNEKPCSNQIKVHGKSSDIVKNSGVRTLKDYLHQCPSKLSEEIVNCMAAVYCWFCSATSTNSDNLGNHQSSGVSKFCGDFNPQLGSQKKHTSKSMLEISSMPTDKKQVSRASYAITSYRALVEQLKRVNVSQMEVEAQIAFWINIYNSLIMHAYLAYGIPHSSLRRLALFHKVTLCSAGGLQHWWHSCHCKCHRTLNLLLSYTLSWWAEGLHSSQCQRRVRTGKEGVSCIQHNYKEIKESISAKDARKVFERSFHGI
ncbi:uncharacterized protein LOC110732342 isoform X1 [Chenopodium quinoa]|uniref:uncharacterized protein LOC110732342 isoform X1 n=1 Tax=Chenopodium quinoa TaxID=63459 RepID=UPI000B7741D3|nr:uncharacterized protein LOC110732342 isoform X1 [Chenopodium quinoa]